MRRYAPSFVLWAHVGLLATVIPLLDRLFSLQTILRLLTPPHHLQPYRKVPTETIAAAVGRRLAHPHNMRRRACLRSGWMLFHFLRLAGRRPVLRIAVYPPQDGVCLRAHCWVTLNGAEVSAPPDGAAAVVVEYDGHTASCPKSICL